jgi:hypothetical protein
MIFTNFIFKKLVRFCQTEKYGNTKVKEYFDKNGQELQSVFVREKQYMFKIIERINIFLCYLMIKWMFYYFFKGLSTESFGFIGKWKEDKYSDRTRFKTTIQYRLHIKHLFEKFLDSLIKLKLISIWSIFILKIYNFLIEHRIQAHTVCHDFKFMKIMRLEKYNLILAQNSNHETKETWDLYEKINKE